MEMIPFLKKGKRSLSDFMARELLYDYATHNLDSEREQAVKDAVETNPNIGKELDDILYGITYCRHLAQTQTKPQMIEKMAKNSFSLKEAKRNLNVRSWNVAYQWIAETLLLSIVLIIIALFVPWQNLIYKIIESKDSGIALTEIKKDKAFKSQDEASKLNAFDQKSEIKVDKNFELKVSNPAYTIHKFPFIVSKMGASLVEQTNADAAPVREDKFLVSVPQANLEAFLKELKTHGELSTLTPAPPSEDHKPILILEISVQK